jgi:hypothetical protein
MCKKDPEENQDEKGELPQKRAIFAEVETVGE